MKIIFSGLEDSGKSLRLAQTAANLVHRNSAWYVQQIKYYKKHGAMAFLKEYKIERPKPRVIKSNLKFSEVFYEYATKEMGVPIMYWKDLDQILYEDDCDIIMDLSLIHISEPTRRTPISYAVFCLKKKKNS